MGHVTAEGVNIDMDIYKVKAIAEIKPPSDKAGLP